jgi:hypothetical protein
MEALFILLQSCLCHTIAHTLLLRSLLALKTTRSWAEKDIQSNGKKNARL